MNSSDDFFYRRSPCGSTEFFTINRLLEGIVQKRIKVLFIAGSGRSGSTILGRILGQIEGFFFAGELCKIWRYGLMENRVCGCGKPFRSCFFWRDIFDEAFGGFGRIDGDEVYRLRQKTAYMRHIPLMLVPGGKLLLSSRMKKFQKVLDRLYHAIEAKTECRVIVDCSKSASYGYILDSIDSVDMSVVHLVRDPRGVACSRLEKRLYQPGEGRPIYTGQAGLFTSAMTWNVQNLAVEAFWKKCRDRYVRIQYEDFSSNPEEGVSRVVEMMKEDTSGLPFLGGHCVRLDEKTHTAAGNPVRFDAGNVEIKPDLAWIDKMDYKSKIFVERLTWPFFAKYGYHSLDADRA